MTDRETLKLALEALEFAASQIYNEDNDDIIADAITAIRQAIDHVPDTTKMIEPDMGIDRGAWDGVPDATKWVDELRGGDETEEEQEPVAWIGHSGNLAYSKNSFMPSVRHLSKPLYTAPPKREWIWLTDEEILVCGGMDGADNWVFQFANALQIKLREKNHG